MLAVLCPGQGAQSPGFLTQWWDIPDIADRLATLAAAANRDLLRAGCDPAADVVDTATAQPLIVLAGVATAGLLGPIPATSVVVGHSVGEITAAAVAGVVDGTDAVGLAALRGRAMAAAAAATPSGMTAVLGADPDVTAACAERVGCWIANHNGAGQLVVAGAAAALERFAADPPPGARLRPLAVAGAFHTPLMAPAQGELQAAVATLAVRDARLPVVSNADGTQVSAGADVAARLVRGLTAPVRFDRCLATLRRLGVTATVELAPGGVLTGLVRRELPEVRAVALRTPADLGEAHDLLAAEQSEAWVESWHLAVAPANGTFRHPRDDAKPLGSVRTRREEVAVAGEGTVLEWLAEDGDPVTAGQPLARLVPAGAP